jgi:hypothetical protein
MIVQPEIPKYASDQVLLSYNYHYNDWMHEILSGDSVLSRTQPGRCGSGLGAQSAGGRPGPGRSQRAAARIGPLWLRCRLVPPRHHSWPPLRAGLGATRPGLSCPWRGGLTVVSSTATGPAGRAPPT